MNVGVERGRVQGQADGDGRGRRRLDRHQARVARRHVQQRHRQRRGSRHCRQARHSRRGVANVVRRRPGFAIIVICRSLALNHRNTSHRLR
jgi:hypothetical protein